MRRAVGIHDAVQAEVAVVLEMGSAEVAPVAPVLPSVFRSGSKSLINPVPDKPTLQHFVLTDCVPIVVEVTQAVAHRVRIFAQDKRSLGIVLSVLHHLRNAGVHGRLYVGVFVLSSPLVLHRPGAVVLLEPLVGSVKVLAVTGLIP